MTAFSDSAFKGKLKDLNSTQQSIQTISLWAIHHRKHHAKIVAIWNEELLEAREAGRKLTLLYFANDVIQNMRKKGPEFQNEFRTALPSAVESAARAAKVEGDEKVAKSLLRLVNVWRERNIFDDPYIVRLENVISGAPLITEAAKPAATILKAPVVIASPSAAMTPKTPTSEPSSLPKRIKIDADFQSFNAKKPVVVKPPEPRGSDDEDYEEVTLNGDLDPPKLETLLRLIQKLQSAPSTNAAIRSRIAELPSVITDPVAIDKLSDRQEVERLVKVAKDGLEVVISYNKELGEELHDRQAVASELARQLAFHRKLIEEKEKLREDLSTEISKRRTFRDQLVVHVDSLPDMSAMSAPTSRGTSSGVYSGKIQPIKSSSSKILVAKVSR